MSPKTPFSGYRTLPSQPTPFIGRQQELADIARRLADPLCRLLTLTGPGGIGKTRLAIEAASAQQNAFADGVCLVPLQPLTGSELIVPAIAEATGFQSHAGAQLKHQLLEYLHDQSLLLVLDNLEHLMDGVVLISEMLAAAPAIKILATSRERLNLLEEWVLNVDGLAVPASEGDMHVEDFESIQLFLHCTQRVQIGFTLNDEQRPAVVRICRSVGGMPLGIELAAGWVRALSCEEIADEIDYGLEILATSARNVPPRHRTMRAMLDHSWSLLASDERDVFQRLSAFRGGFRKEAAQHVAGASLQTLFALVDKSLLRVDASGRYDLHELLWQYAREKLNQSGEAKAILERHRDYFLSFAEQAEQELIGAFRLDWFKRIETERDNFSVVIDSALESGDITSILRLIGSLYNFWSLLGYRLDSYERLIAILSRPEAKDQTALHAKALNAAGRYYYYQGNYATTWKPAACWRKLCRLPRKWAMRGSVLWPPGAWGPCSAASVSTSARGSHLRRTLHGRA